MLNRFRSLAITVIIVALIDVAIAMLAGCSNTVDGTNATDTTNTQLHKPIAPRYPFTGYWIRNGVESTGQSLAIREVGEIVVLETSTETIPVVIIPLEGKSAFALVVTPAHMLRLTHAEPEITITQYKGDFALSTLGTWKRR